jgi:hypothetical protein
MAAVFTRRDRPNYEGREISHVITDKSSLVLLLLMVMMLLGAADATSRYACRLALGIHKRTPHLAESM